MRTERDYEELLRAKTAAEIKAVDQERIIAHLRWRVEWADKAIHMLQKAVPVQVPVVGTVKEDGTIEYS